MAFLSNRPWARHGALVVGMALLITFAWSGLAFAEGADHGGGHSSGLPQFNAATFPSQLAWLLLTFLFLYALVALVALPRIRGTLETRDSKINADLNRAEELKNGSTELLAKVEAQLAAARADAQALLASTSDEIEKRIAKHLATVDAEINAKVKQTELTVLQAKQRAITGIKAEAVAVALELTRKLSGSEIDPSAVAQAVAQVSEERA